MRQPQFTHRSRRLAALALVCLPLATGCLWDNRPREPISAKEGLPRELAKTTLPTYRIEPPDVLLIDAVKIVPKEPYLVEPLDILTIFVTGTPEENPIAGEFRVDVNGSVALGPGYGRVKVVGYTVEDAQKRITEELGKVLRTAEVSVSLAQPGARQAIAGEHVVMQDGTINLGVYGPVRVVGLTDQQAREVIEEHLSQFLEDPQVAVDIASFNSKVYYVILQGAGQGDQVMRVPVTGNETVLDALSSVGGFTSSQCKKMWIARPAPDGLGYDQVLPVDWVAITEGGSTSTNYQLMPGDRLFIAEDKLVTLDTAVQKMTAPFERLFGFTLLGVQTVQTINRSPTGFNGTNNNN